MTIIKCTQLMAMLVIPIGLLVSTQTQAVECLGVNEFPAWTQTNRAGNPNHAISGDLMQRGGVLYQATSRTRMAPGNNNSWVSLGGCNAPDVIINATPVDIRATLTVLFQHIRERQIANGTLNSWVNRIESGSATCEDAADRFTVVFNNRNPDTPKNANNYYALCDDTPIAEPNCETNPSPSCNTDGGSVGSNTDDNATLPMRPSQVRNVHLLDAPTDTAMRDRGTISRPHIPPYRTTRDGRVAMQTRTRSDNPNEEIFHFYLYVPEKVNGSFLNSQNDLAILSSKQPFSLRRNQFVNTNTNGETVHSALCDAIQDGPRSCGANNRNDCYTFKVITPFRDDTRERIEIWGTQVTVEVRNPKTVDAAIADIRTSTPRRGAIWPNAGPLLETMITGDGRLLAGRLGNSPITFQTESGRTISGRYNAIYSVIDPSQPACDENLFEQPYPISHMSYHDVIRDNYGVGAYRWTDHSGNIIADGADMRGSYPWLDSQGGNIFITTSSGRLFNRSGGQTTADYQVRCVPGRPCQGGAYPANLDLVEQADDTRAITVIGAWTKGRAVLIDNMMNNVDFGLRARPSGQREYKLFRENDGWVRVGAGRQNGGDTTRVTMAGNSGNINFVDSIENKLNAYPHMKPNLPRDVSWFMSNGSATSVVAFDDWIDPHVLITSEMVQAKSGIQATPNHRRIQNGASGRYQTPAYGQIVGNGSVERVALGGTRGKGFFARPSSGLRYTVPTGQSRNLQNDVWYLGVFLDPRMANDANYRRLIEFQDGSGIDVRGRNGISFQTAGGERFDHDLNGVLNHAQYSHLGFRVHPNGTRVEIFRDGMLILDWTNPTNQRLFVMGAGDLWLGRGADVTPSTGFHGWLDDFKVIGETQNMSPEEICNHALGSLVALDNAAPTSLADEAGRYPADFHNSVRQASGATQFSQFICYDHNANQDGWVDLNILPSNLVSLRDQILFPEGPLQYNVPRPDSSNNNFCVSCHAADGNNNRPASLLVDALIPRQLPMQNDQRRQPLQPPAQIHGVIPAYTFGDQPRNTLRANNGQDIDELISQ